jgi:hypothetical protein
LLDWVAYLEFQLPLLVLRRKASRVQMIPYASNTGTRRNLAVMRAAGWRLLLTPDNPTPRDGLRFAIDNGAFAKDGFQPEPFRDLVERLGCAADFVVLPDIVAGGASLKRG